MRRTAASVIVFAVALAIGASLSWGNGGIDDTVTTQPSVTPTTAQPREVFASQLETVVGPAVVVAAEPYLSGSELVVGFDLINLAPTADSATVVRQLGFGNSIEVQPGELDILFLDDWWMEAGDERIPGTTANPAARTARFEVGAEFDVSTLGEIGIDSFALLAPLSADVHLGPGNETAVVAPGLTARLLAVTEQAKTIVQIEMISTRNFNLDNLRVTGIGPGWLSSVREAEGRPRWNLTHESADAPDPIEIRVEGAGWLVVQQSHPVVIEASQ